MMMYSGPRAQGQPLQRTVSTRASGCPVPIRTGTPFPWQGAQWQALTSFWNSSRARFMFCFTVLEKAKSVAVTSSYRGSAWEGRRGTDCNRQHLSDRSVKQGCTGNGQGSVHGDQRGFIWNWINATAYGWTPHRLSVPPHPTSTNKLIQVQVNQYLLNTSEVPGIQHK